jgi:hypothetical protein
MSPRDYCGQEDEGLWAPVAGAPAQAPAPPPPIVAPEPIPEGALEIDEEEWDPCAPWVFPDADELEPVYEVTLDPGLLLPPFQELPSLQGVSVATGLMRSYEVEIVPLVGAIESSGRLAASIDSVQPQIVEAVYSQRSVYSSNVPATAAGMQNNSHAETTQTATNWHSASSGGAWLQMNFGRVREFDSIVVGCDFNNTLAGGWGKSYTENAEIMASNDGATWTNIGNTGIFLQGIQAYETPGQAWQYVRLVKGDDYIVATEFHALTNHFFVPLLGAATHSAHKAELSGATTHSPTLTPTLTAMTIHAGVRTLWTPEHMASPTKELWLDGLAPNAFTLDGEEIVLWSDRSGLGRHAGQVQEGLNPLYAVSPVNQLPGVTFRPPRAPLWANDRLRVPADWASDEDARSLFRFLHFGQSHIFVAATSGYTSAMATDVLAGILSTTTAQSSGAGVFLRTRTMSGNTARIESQIIAPSNGSVRYEFTGNVMGRGGVDLLEFRGDALNATTANRVRLYANGTESQAGGSGAATAQNVDAFWWLDIGHVSNNAPPFTGVLHEVLIVSGHPDAALLDRIRGYMAHRWGTADKLPALHPYKNTPPLLE